ncbi:hypothetical protein DL96DRAFT_109689 [Flagelloscypha sp. PMI_526]|nr:hypothetical protein DL96DRAFT_109689 [Flagelloscypha sp. PMI_526]
MSYCPISIVGFRGMLSQLSRSDFVNAVILTRPPETIVCIYIPIDKMRVFAIFEPRPSSTIDPNFVCWTACKGIQQTAPYLQNMLPFDEDLLKDPGLGWQAELSANFAAHFIQYKRPDAGAASASSRAYPREQESHGMASDARGRCRGKANFAGEEYQH